MLDGQVERGCRSVNNSGQAVEFVVRRSSNTESLAFFGDWHTRIGKEHPRQAGRWPLPWWSASSG